MSKLLEKIPLMRPSLPCHDLVAPYLHEIDSNRWYTNFGPLLNKFIDQLAKIFGMTSENIIAVSNGTIGLINILRALNLPKDSYCLLPSWTFTASPASIIASGLTPYFIDVDEESWALNPDVVKKKLHEIKNVSAVMVVSPFGAPIDTREWDLFSEETGIPVIIDAAAGFDSFTSIPFSRPGKNPVMISLHATKPLGIGEGGIVISSDSKLVEEVNKMSNFGFCGSRVSQIPGTNGKVSEYQAAIGLAAINDWAEKRALWQKLKINYIEAINKLGVKIEAPSLYGNWVSSTLNIRLYDRNAENVMELLNENGVESRQWWGIGCHNHIAYADYPKTPLPVTSKLAGSVLALPYSVDMTKEEVWYVVKTLSSILKLSKPGKVG